MVPGSTPGPRTILRGDSSAKQSPCNLHVMDLWASRLMTRHHPCKMGDAGASPARSTNSALSAMGRRPGFQPGKASSSLARAARRRSSSNGESARLRTGRLGDHTLRAAPVHRDRLTGGLGALNASIVVRIHVPVPYPCVAQWQSARATCGRLDVQIVPSGP